MGISHEWNGTILTITSDSGSSSCDLKGEKGDTGIRGPQGPAGVVIGGGGGPEGDYYTKEEIDERLGDIEAVLNEIEALQDSLIGGEAE